MCNCLKKKKEKYLLKKEAAKSFTLKIDKGADYVFMYLFTTELLR